MYCSSWGQRVGHDRATELRWDCGPFLVFLWPEVTQTLGLQAVSSMVTAKRVYAKGDLPRLVPHPSGEPLPSRASTGDPTTLAGKSGSVSSGGTATFC